MCSPEPDSSGDAFRQELVAHGLLVPSGVDGVYGRGGTFEHVIECFERIVSAAGREDNPEVIRFPPVLPRRHYEKTGHFGSFPDQLGSVHSFEGDEKEHQRLAAELEQRGDWAATLAPSELVLIPAACYPLYPAAAGTLPENGRLVDLRSFVFRHEPSISIDRWQCFRHRCRRRRWVC